MPECKYAVVTEIPYRRGEVIAILFETVPPGRHATRWEVSREYFNSIDAAVMRANEILATPAPPEHSSFRYVVKEATDPVPEKQSIKLWVDSVIPAPDDTWCVATNSHDAIHYLFSSRVTEISLTYNLEPKSQTGYAIADFIEALACHDNIPRIKWHIHSTEPADALQMRQALENADKYWSERERSKRG
jgi:hypothetical protein